MTARTIIGGVGEDLREAAALGFGHELTPRNALAVRATRKSSPVLGLGADSDRVAVATHRVRASEPRAQDLQIGSDLLRPVAGHTAADREDAHRVVLADAVREFVEIEKGIEFEGALALVCAQVVVDAHVEAELRIRERRNEDRDIVFDRALENSAARTVLL